eukprot:CAMPEP_0182605424 /NCGR_PEP_ID=MMETSP1330-20130603/370_1 /TAXON_ID=464278 /ORGANISM="Picochlorum sp., Strain RCC944" /LENGTH=142 /DNA_ID=CAMNT_0024823409 /DNA_START=21 /DNA_END=447 /DNA_ORIENTATION=+
MLITCREQAQDRSSLCILWRVQHHLQQQQFVRHGPQQRHPAEPAVGYWLLFPQHFQSSRECLCTAHFSGELSSSVDPWMTTRVNELATKQLSVSMPIVNLLGIEKTSAFSHGLDRVADKTSAEPSVHVSDSGLEQCWVLGPE